MPLTGKVADRARRGWSFAHGPLNQLAGHPINTRLIRERYDDVLGLAGGLLQRHRSQTWHLVTLARAL